MLASGVLGVTNVLSRRLRAVRPWCIAWRRAASMSVKDWKGSWQGGLVVQEGTPELTMVFHVDDEGECSMDVPAQGAMGLKGTVLIDGPSVTMDISGLGKFVTSTASPNTHGAVAGQWVQGGAAYDLSLKKMDHGECETLNRPQTPHEPFPYVNHDVEFKSFDDAVLRGTLGVPGGDCIGSIILLAGSGKHTRDQDVFGHKTLLVLADHLCRRGFAVLRYDKRGVGASEGASDDITIEHLSKDAVAAVEFMREGQEQRMQDLPIGLCGHSEGGMTAAWAAAERLESVSALVLLGSMAMTGREISKRQYKSVMGASGMSAAAIDFVAEHLNRPLFDLIERTGDAAALDAALDAGIKEILDQFDLVVPDELRKDIPVDGREKMEQSCKASCNSWTRHFLTYDPCHRLAEIAKSPVSVLVVNGEKDLQVPIENLQAHDEVFRAHRGEVDGVIPRYHSIAVPNVNHLLQPCESGAVEEYVKIETTIDPRVLDSVASFLVGCMNRE